MPSLHMLTLRTNAARGRLASLQRRAETAAGPTGSVLRPALKELTDALDELQVANDQLQTQVDELSVSKVAARRAELRFSELLDWLPVACVWTSGAGDVVDANPAAAALLNVSTQHLVGRSLALFMTERTRFGEALGTLAASAGSVFVTTGLRPRERRTRAVQVVGRKSSQEERYCWFLLEQPEASAAPGIAP